MTIKLVTILEEGEASVVDIGLPTELVVGTVITGTIDIKNVGVVADDLRCLFITEWNNKGYQAIFSAVPVGTTVRSTIPASLGIIMPSVDAVVTVHGQHDEAGVWVTDDTKTH